MNCSFPVRFVAPVCLFLLALFPTTLAFGQSGAYTAPANLDQLVQQARMIVRGRVTSARVEPHPQFSNLQTVVVTLAITKVLKGEAASTFTFREYLLDARDAHVFTGYKSSGELLLFLNPVSPYGLTSPVGLEQGRFRILRDAKGNRYAVNGRGNVGLFDQVASKVGSRGAVLSKPAREMMSKPAGQAPLDAFEDAIQALAGAAK